MTESKPEWTLPYLQENYTGPWLSNGKFQSSVAFGEAEPQSILDALSRLHDTAYATYSDWGHRAAADAIYDDAAKKLKSAFPQIAGKIVLYGNPLVNFTGNLTSSQIAKYMGLFGLPGQFLATVVTGAQNYLHIHDYMLNSEKYKKELLQLYASDPVKKRNEAMKGIANVASTITTELDKLKKQIAIGKMAAEMEVAIAELRKQAESGKISYLDLPDLPIDSEPAVGGAQALNPLQAHGPPLPYELEIGRRNRFHRRKRRRRRTV